MTIRADAHHHVWDLARGDYDWIAPADCPTLLVDYRADDLLPHPRNYGIDAAVLISHSTQLALLVGAYFLSIAIYNFLGLTVAKRLSSVHRTLIDACRTTIVWSVDLLIYYSTGMGRYGEKWVTEPSLVEMLGFVFMIIGTFVYYSKKH